MSSPEPGGLPVLPTRPAPRGRFRTWVLVVSVAVVVIALVAALLARSSSQAFSDPLGLYSLRLPPGWTAQGGIQPGGTLGNRYGSEVLTQDEFKFSDPSEGPGSADVFILATQIKTTFDRQTFCGPPPYTNSLFHIYPAWSTSFASWIFATGNASFQIDATIPDVDNHPGSVELNSVPTATPIPASWTVSDVTYVYGILDSFHPSDPNPLDC